MLDHSYIVTMKNKRASHENVVLTALILWPFANASEISAHKQNPQLSSLTPQLLGRTRNSCHCLQHFATGYRNTHSTLPPFATVCNCLQQFATVCNTQSVPRVLCAASQGGRCCLPTNHQTRVVEHKGSAPQARPFSKVTARLSVSYAVAHIWPCVAHLWRIVSRYRSLRAQLD